MADENKRPHGRERGGKTSQGTVYKRDEKVTDKKVGNADYSERPSGNGKGSSDGSRSAGTRSSGGGLFKLLLIAAIALFGGGTGLSALNNNTTPAATATPRPTAVPTSTPAPAAVSAHYVKPSTTYVKPNSSAVSTSVSNGARAKYTKLVGNGNDQVTIMIYMCATDLESKYGMATADLNEMIYASHSDKVNVIIETGGVKQWRNTAGFSTSTVQRWRLVDGGLEALNTNVGNLAMTDPNTLVDFIQYGAQNYPADRYFLILWDHGGGSVSGYGYDERYPNGTMTLDEVSAALRAGGVKFDVLGFDACLMATAETAVAAEPYADYLIASEETEPGTGWYYTNWLSMLAQNSSTPTLDVARQLIDDFTTQSAKSGRGEQTSLSIVDLAEFQALVPEKLSAFAKSVSAGISGNEFRTFANARKVSKEFASSNRIDQVDLVHFALNTGTAEGKALAEAVQSCVKYNRINNMTNAYGMSIFFPYYSPRSVNAISKIYERIGMNSDYGNAVTSFATMESSGQIVSQNTNSSIYQMLNGASASNGTVLSTEDILGLLMGGGSSSSGYAPGSELLNLLGGGSSYSSGTSLDLIAQMLGGRSLDPQGLVLSEKNGEQVVILSQNDWDLVNEIALNVWVDDGSGYIDLGLDNIYDFNEDGDLRMSYDGLWLGLNDHIVSYYVLSEEDYDDGTYVIEGYVPAILNGEQVNILIEFSSENPDGIVLGAQVVYEEGVEAKGLTPIEEGDTIDFLCDYYDYNGNYDATYPLGETMTVVDAYPEDDTQTLEVGNIEIVNNRLLYSYRLSDIYNAHSWTPMIEYQK